MKKVELAPEDFGLFYQLEAGPGTNKPKG